jgi:hypothetical protein
VCICKFVENYSKPASINGYFSRPVFRNYHSEIFGTMKYLATSWVKSRKNTTSGGIMDKDVIMDNNHDSENDNDNDIQNCGEDLEEWWQKQRENVMPPDPSLIAFSGYRCYFCGFETEAGKGSKSRYENHVKSNHGDDLDHPCYPTKADIERLGLWM